MTKNPEGTVGRLSHYRPYHAARSLRADSVRVTVEDGKFLAQVSYEDRESVKEWGFRWSPAKSLWMCPANLISAAAILADASPGDDVSAVREWADREGRPCAVGTAGVKSKPMPHQLEGAGTLLGRNRFGLFFEMATGKTFAAFLAVNHLFTRGGARRAIVLCPVSLFSTWREEAEKHLKISYPFHVLWGTKRLKELEAFLGDPGCCFAITSWDTLPRILDPLLKGIAEEKVILIGDESSFIKNRKASRTKAAIALADACAYVTALTGTPYVSNVCDLWSQMRFLSRAYAGESFWRYASRYVEFDRSPWRRPIGIRFEMKEELKALVNKVSMTVRKADVLSLPAKMRQGRVLEPAPGQKRVLSKMMDEFYFMVKAVKKGGKSAREEKILIRNALARVNKIQQVTMGWTKNETGEVVYFKENPKVDAFLDVLQEAEGHKIVVFSRFVEDLEILSGVLKKAKASSCLFHGRVPENVAQKNLEGFRKGPTRVFLCQVQKGGFGLDLSMADVCVYLSNWWSVGVRRQSEDRLHRPGQKSNPIYIDLMIKDSVDETIRASIERNQGLVAYLFGRKEE